MSLGDQILSSLLQTLVVLLVAALCYFPQRLWRRETLAGFARGLGLVRARAQIDTTYLGVGAGVILFAVATTALEFNLLPEVRELLLSDRSPYGKILQSNPGTTAYLPAFIYCYFQAAASEELLFRGLIGRTLARHMAFARANLIQAALFWLVHFLLVYAITDEVISLTQLVTLLTSFGLGWLGGYLNQRRGGASLVPSWLLHGTCNFSTFLTLAYYWPDL